MTVADPEDDPDLDAAERALGTLPAGRETPEARAARERWEARFAGIAATVEPVEPPADLLDRIERRIDREDVDRFAVDLARERRASRLWRAGAIAASTLLAVVIAAWALAPGVPDRYVAVVYSDDDPDVAGMVVHLDPRAGTATVIPILPPAPADADYEMWQLREGETRPTSLGLLPRGPVVRPRIEAEPGDLFAISLEPPGGSPTGQPTQALYHGRVVEADDP